MDREVLEVLKFYANPFNYADDIDVMRGLVSIPSIMHDNGQKARELLNKINRGN